MERAGTADGCSPSCVRVYEQRPQGRTGKDAGKSRQKTSGCKKRNAGATGGVGRHPHGRPGGQLGPPLRDGGERPHGEDSDPAGLGPARCRRYQSGGKPSHSTSGRYNRGRGERARRPPWRAAPLLRHASP